MITFSDFNYRINSRSYMMPAFSILKMRNQRLYINQNLVLDLLYNKRLRVKQPGRPRKRDLLRKAFV